MSSFSSTENIKGLFCLLDHYSFTRNLENNPDAFQTKGVQAIIKEKGFRPAAKHLLKNINQKPADVKAIAKAFGLKGLGKPPVIKASHIWEKVLDSPAERKDLYTAMEKIWYLELSKATRAALFDLVVILDLIANEKTFAQGVRPGAKAYQQTFNKMGTVPAIKKLFKLLTAQDKAELAKLFGIKKKGLSPKTLMHKALSSPEDDWDLKEALCKIDPKECPKKTTAAGQELLPMVKSMIKDKKVQKTAEKLVQAMAGSEKLSAYLKPEHQLGAAVFIAYLMEHKSQELAGYLKENNMEEVEFTVEFELYPAYREALMKVFKVFPGTAKTEAQVKKAQQEYFQLKEDFYSLQSLVKALRGDTSIAIDIEGDSPETIMKAREATFAWLIPHRRVTAKFEEIMALKDNDQMMAALHKDLDFILDNILQIPDKKIRQEFAEQKFHWFLYEIKVTPGNLFLAKGVLNKLDDPLFERASEMLEKRIKEAGE